jgi:hypothetical protein
MMDNAMTLQQAQWYWPNAAQILRSLQTHVSPMTHAYGLRCKLWAAAHGVAAFMM